MKVFAYVVYLLQSLKLIFFMKIQVKLSSRFDERPCKLGYKQAKVNH